MNRDEFKKEVTEEGRAALAKIGDHMAAHPKGYLIALGVIVAFALGAYLF